MTSKYILGESAGETERLRLQAEQDPVEGRVLRAGLRKGMDVIDAGCGPGEIARTLSRLVGQNGTVRGFDLSEARIGAARSVPVARDEAPREFAVGELTAPPFAKGSADFVFCQYVFQYLPAPTEALASLAGLLRPGGRLMICDGDSIAQTNWPFPPDVEQGLARLFAQLQTTGFDPLVGRKLYHWMQAAGLQDIRVEMYPYFVHAGAAPQAELEAWRQRYEALAPFGAAAFGSEESYQAFVSGYLAMLGDPSSLKYAVAFAVSGTRT